MALGCLGLAAHEGRMASFRCVHAGACGGKECSFLVSLNPGQVLGQQKPTDLCWICTTKNLANVFPTAASIHVCSRSAQLSLSVSLPISQSLPQTYMCSGKRMEDPQPRTIPGWPHPHPHTAEMIQCQPHLSELTLTNIGSFQMLDEEDAWPGFCQIRT